MGGRVPGMTTPALGIHRTLRCPWCGALIPYYKKNSHECLKLSLFLDEKKVYDANSMQGKEYPEES